MKTILLAIFLFCSSLVFAQPSFSTKAEALSWLKATFAQKFVKTQVAQTADGGDGYVEGIIFNYEFSDNALIIYRAQYLSGAVFQKRKLTNLEWRAVSYDKIDEVDPSTTSTFFKAMTDITFRSNCRCFKGGKGNKIKKMDEFSVKDIGKFTELYDALTIPFNLIDGPDISSEIISAFKLLGGSENNIPINQQNRSKVNKNVDSVKIANENKMFAYLTIPQYDVLTKDGSTINLPEYLSSHRNNTDKPTLLVTWAYKWCVPCIKRIDSLLNMGTALSYNIVLINRDDEETKTKYPSLFISFSDLKTELAAHSPKYDEDALLLFDRNNELSDIDNGATPLWVWLDKKLNIIGAYQGYAISVADIRNVLSNIEQGKITNGAYKYYNNGIPCEPGSASIKKKVTNLPDSNTVLLEVYDAGKDVPSFEIEYLMNKKGKLFYKELQAN